MLEISRAYHAHRGNYTLGGNSCRYIVVHNTSNTANARAEASYAQNDQHPSSYHYVLDGSNPVYQILDDSDTAWAVGAWSGARQLIGNNESISIEVCSNGTEFTGSEVAQLTELVGMLMKRHGIPASRVVRHYDCHTGHKDCPAYYVNQSRWDALWKVITSGVIENGVIVAECEFQPDGKGYMVWFDGTNAHGVASLDEEKAIKMVYRNATGKELPVFALGSKTAPFAYRFYQALNRGWKY